MPDEAVKVKEQLNGNGYCPHCGSTALIPDPGDLACQNCGWRESNYFYEQRKALDPALIKWLIFNSVDVL